MTRDLRNEQIATLAKVRAELASAGLSLADAGVTIRSVAAEVLLMLPAEFVEQYELLWLKTQQGSLEAPNRNANEVASSRQVDTRVSSNGSTTMRPATPGKKKGAGKTPGVKDERALAVKQRVDRKLRKIAREMTMMLTVNEVRSSVRRCTRSSCRKYAESEWAFCPYDGAPTEEVDVQ